jgi:hypothetical protein
MGKGDITWKRAGERCFEGVALDCHDIAAPLPSFELAT